VQDWLATVACDKWPERLSSLATWAIEEC